MTQPGAIRVNPVPYAATYVQHGISAREGLRMARAEGVKIRDATWFKLYSQQRAVQVATIEEMAAPLNRRPQGNEIRDWTHRAGQGYIQYVEVYVRDKETGIVSQRPYAIRNADLITRDEAIKQALDRFTVETSPEGSYAGETVFGAAYTATYRLVPRTD